ncbi:MAG: transposase [Candidatus Blackburnbacteria bacterium]|nr:transposase [Candidatus Blackburnbacteria bacterium]
MPSRHKIKKYFPNSYYHIYNRGVEKRLIFQDAQDYGVLLSYLKEYLLPKDEELLRTELADPTINYHDRDKILKALRLNNFTDEITLLAYCLMPNHFHFFVKQRSENSIDRFMQSLCTRYSMYFNRKYKRVGRLFQDIYKAVLVDADPQFTYLSKYIHKQALASQGTTLQAYSKQPSSFEEYLGQRKTKWVHPEEVLGYFSKANPAKDYQAFVEEQELGPVDNILLEEH